jgi:hypothetical protein
MTKVVGGRDEADLVDIWLERFFVDIKERKAHFILLNFCCPAWEELNSGSVLNR